tara:strand:- start:15409 stop:16626 length:1218 start_codon:yes stop_codon:yes gene_type:complete
MWEHPKLSESIRKVFHQETKIVIPKRSLNDSLLQGANREAYLRFLGKTSNSAGSLTVPVMARNTYQGILSNFGAALNYTNPDSLDLEAVSTKPPALMRSKSFHYTQRINWKWQYKVKYDNFSQMPSNKGIVSEVGLYNFQPTNNSWISWNKWIYDDWYAVCQSTPIKCKNIAGQGTLQNHVRVRYRAYISPDPMQHSYFNADSGSVFGEIHSSQSVGAGIIGHQLIVEADVATTESNFFKPQALKSPGFGEAVPVAVFGIDITNLTTNQKVSKEFAVNYGDAGGKIEHTFMDAGLYQIFVYLKSTEGQGITVSKALASQIRRRNGNVGNASHPLRFLLFVSPAPDTLVPEVTVEVEESDNNPTFTTQTDTVQLVDNREDDSEPDYKYLLAVGVLVGSLILVGGRN